MKKYLFIGATVILALLFLGLAGYAYAQTQAPPGSENASESKTTDSGLFQNRWGKMFSGDCRFWPDMGGVFGFRSEGPLHEYVEEAIASVLGLTSEDLQARLESGETLPDIIQAQGLTLDEFRARMIQAAEERIAQALTDGAITQEQADRLLQRLEQMPPGGLFTFKMKRVGPGTWMGWMHINRASLEGPWHPYLQEAVAEALGISPEELQSRIKAGDSPLSIALEKGFTEEQFRELMIQAHTNAINQALADGVITQQQADRMIQKLNRMPENGVPFGPGKQGPGRQGWRWNPLP